MLFDDSGELLWCSTSNSNASASPPSCSCFAEIEPHAAIPLLLLEVAEETIHVLHTMNKTTHPRLLSSLEESSEVGIESGVTVLAKLDNRSDVAL